MDIYNKKTKKELVKIVFKRDKKLAKKETTIDSLKEKICELERKLLAYENAHTPPSKKLFPKKVKKKNKCKLGARRGHPKYTRKVPEKINKTIRYDKVYEEYEGRELVFIGERVVFEEEIPEPQDVFVTKHIINIYMDVNTGRIIAARNNAPQGAFGKNAETHISLLKFTDRLPFRKVSESLERQHKLKITDVGIYNIVKRVSRKLQVPYYEIIKAIRSSGVIYIDETQFKVNGKKWWLWVFVSEKTVLFVLRDSRGEEVVEEILGKEFKGKISADGYQVYKKFAKILQRCWAHLLRESEELSDKYKDFKSWDRLIRNLFNEICKIRKKPPPLEKRLVLKQKMRDRLESIAKNLKRCRRFKKLGIKIFNGLDAWFTCVEHLDIEPTNNFAEQSLREPIIQRKIMGGLRSKDGAIVLEVMCSCIATWKKQEKPLFQTLKSHL